jgi:hypothetical protein
MLSSGEGGLRLHSRVAGVAVSRGRVLLHPAEHEDFWSLPGGRPTPSRGSETPVRHRVERAVRPVSAPRKGRERGGGGAARAEVPEWREIGRGPRPAAGLLGHGAGGRAMPGTMDALTVWMVPQA